MVEHTEDCGCTVCRAKAYDDAGLLLGPISEPLPEGFKPLDPDLDYVDVTDFDRKMLSKMNEMMILVDATAKAVLGLQKSMIEVRRKQIELEADMGAAGIGSADKKSALILPDRMQ